MRKPLYHFGADFCFTAVEHFGGDLLYKLLGSGLTNEQSWNIHGGKTWLYYAAFGDVVKTNNGNVFRDAISAKLKGFKGTDGDNVIVSKIAPGNLCAIIYYLQHISHGIFDGWGKLMNYRTGF